MNPLFPTSDPPGVLATVKTPDESANLDFLRAFAVLSVYIGHLLQIFNIEKIFGRATIFDFAQTGVLIFFVHTSLVLMLSMERMRVSGLALITPFYIRRIFRIYPLSMVTVILMVVSRVPEFPTQGYFWVGWGHLISNLALTQNLTGNVCVNSVLWSLPYEVQMYLILPIIFIFIQRFRSIWVPIGLWFVAVAIVISMVALNMKAVSQFLMYTPCFLSGIIGYNLWRGSRMRLPFWGWPSVIIACVGLRVIVEATNLRGATTISAWVASLWLGLTVAQFRELRSGFVRWLVAEIAKYSYGIYLSHLVVFWIAFFLLKHWPPWFQGLICAALSVFFPLAMYYGIEKPMIAVGLRVARRSSQKPLLGDGLKARISIFD